MIDKKKQQLGMNPSTAAGRLVKDILWSLLIKTEQNLCCKCGEHMSRETFSIEHVIPWLDSKNPIDLYFDLSNISFSHLSCNMADRRFPDKAPCGTQTKYSKHGCRCDACKEAQRVSRLKYYDPVKRAEDYKRRGN